MGWGQKEKGDILDISNFTPKKVKQRSLSDTTADDKAVACFRNKCGKELFPFNTGQSSLAVLKELLQKRQLKLQRANEPSRKPQLNRSISYPSEQSDSSKNPCSVLQLNKVQAFGISKAKETKSLSPRPNSEKQCEVKFADHSLSGNSPVFFSDPGFDSCYSLEDSLSPEQNYNFDINTLGETEFCSLYSGSQFVAADLSLPQKFLSDVLQDSTPGQVGDCDPEVLKICAPNSQGEKSQQPLDQPAWTRSYCSSPDLFDRSSSESKDRIHSGKESFSRPHPGHVENSVTPQHSANIPNEITPQGGHLRSTELSLIQMRSRSQDWVDSVNKKPSSSGMYLPLHSRNTSPVEVISSPDENYEDSDLSVCRNNGTLTSTPSSSPRSVCSPSQSKNGGILSRTPGAHILKPLMSPPSRGEIIATLLDHNLPEMKYQEPFFSDPTDAPEKAREIGGHRLVVETRLPNGIQEFEGDFTAEGMEFWKTVFSAMTQNPRPSSPVISGHSCRTTQTKQHSNRPGEDKKVTILPCKYAPSRHRVEVWLQAKKEYEQIKKCPQSDSAVDKKYGAQVLHLNGIVSPCRMPVIMVTEPVKGLTASSACQPMESTRSSPECISPSCMSPVRPVESVKNGNESKMLPSVSSTLPPDDENGEDGSDGNNNCNYSSPDSPLLPPWQPVTSPGSKSFSQGSDGVHASLAAVEAISCRDDLTTELCACELGCVKGETKESVNISPFKMNVPSAGEPSIVCLHSTPILQKKTKTITPEALRYSPVSAEIRSQRLSQRKSSKNSSLRRGILTTQLKNQFAGLNCPKKESSQIEGPSLNNSYGFKVSLQNLQEAKALHEIQHLSLFSMELHARNRRDLEPDPEFDPICALFYCITSDTPLPDMKKLDVSGALIVDKDHAICRKGGRSQCPLLARSGIAGLQVTYCTDERQLLQALSDIIRRYDPDILVGYEVQMHSWGYVLQRAAALEVNLCQMISRILDDKENMFVAEKDEYGADTMSEIHIAGRIILNIWRMMRPEVALTNYSFENVAFHILHQRYPLFTFRVLSDWFDTKTDIYRWKMVDYYLNRVQGNLRLLEKLDLVGRTSELARVFGIQFYHVLTRGSQYRVESMMLRIAKPMNYLPVTPSVMQRAKMRAAQCIPLVMEPESRFYSNSVVVLDFQSLYPSIIIAYNYCFSTCLGHVEDIGKHDEFKFGCSTLRVPPDLLYQLRNDITISPNGFAFVKPSVRKGTLPSMLEEILKTRLMVKQSMKAYRNDKCLTRLLDARQLGLKLIANVTYGYTAANFSGRMPCVEVGDSVVHKARETLERAIKLVNDTKKWGAHVVYGDTDSMFVLLKGATKEQAFKIGQEIADAVTATNPKPVKLKFEKVYLPCVLQSKKRYVGYMYETLDQKDPVFDAKGIETVRRDSCPAAAKILERSLKLLFETRDISLIKQYVQRQCLKLLEGKASIQDFIFAKEYRGLHSYRPGACVPALELTRRMLSYDRRLEPRVGERVPYVIVYGMPGVALIQLVRRPTEVLKDPSIRLNATYYITKQILPPLDRIFTLIGVDVFSWYHELPKVQKACSTACHDQEGRKGTISQYFTTLHCPICDELTQHGICNKCRSQPQQVAVILNQGIRELERKQDQLLKICKNCTGCFEQQIPCVSLNCPVLFKLSTVNRELSKAPYLRQLLDQF